MECSYFFNPELNVIQYYFQIIVIQLNKKKKRRIKIILQKLIYFYFFIKYPLLQNFQRGAFSKRSMGRKTSKLKKNKNQLLFLVTCNNFFNMKQKSKKLRIEVRNLYFFNSRFISFFN